MADYHWHHGSLYFLVDLEHVSQMIGDIDKAAWAQGLLVLGVDEVGRGSLAGPVYAAAVLLNPKIYPEGINDSKQLSPEKRRDLDEKIRKSALAFAYGAIEAQEIDVLNIRRATMRAMNIAIEQILQTFSLGKLWIVVDGTEVPIPRACPIIKGDCSSLCIAAASIIAKVKRDEEMAKYAKEFPAYGFEQNSGYGSAVHLAALREHGPCPIHRRTFIQKILGEQAQGKLF